MCAADCRRLVGVRSMNRALHASRQRASRSTRWSRPLGLECPLPSCCPRPSPPQIQCILRKRLIEATAELSEVASAVDFGFWFATCRRCRLVSTPPWSRNPLLSGDKSLSRNLLMRRPSSYVVRKLVFLLPRFHRKQFKLAACTTDTARAEALIKSAHAIHCPYLKLAPKLSHVNTVAGLDNDAIIDTWQSWPLQKRHRVHSKNRLVETTEKLVDMCLTKLLVKNNQ